MDVDQHETSDKASKETEYPVPEVETFLTLLVIVYLIDHKRHEDVHMLYFH